MNAQLIAVTKERDHLATSLVQTLKLMQRLSATNKELESALKKANKDCEDLKGELKDFQDKYAKLKDMHFGNNGNKTGDKDDGHSENKDEPKPFSSFNDQEINAAVENLGQLVDEANLEREIERQKTKAERDAEKEKRRGSKARGRISEEKRRNLPVRENHIYPEGYDPEKHLIIGTETREVLRRIPAQLYLERITLYACKDRPDCSDNANDPGANSPQGENADNTKIYKGLMPALPFKGVNVGADFMAWVIMSKFMFSLPEYRIIRMLKQDGVSWLSTSTLNDWVRYAAEKLYPLYLQQWKFVFESDYVQGDEVVYFIADQPGMPVRKGASWQVFDASDGRRGCVFIFEAGSRSAEVAKKIFKDYEGAAQFDAYAGYKGLREKDGVLVLICTAHALRRFRDSFKLYKEEDARIFYDAIQAMYDIDHTLEERNADFDTIKATRLEKTLPIFNSLVDTAQKVVTKVRPKSGFGRALRYFLDNADGIRNVFKDGRYHWDNNTVERHNRTTTLGRKNYLFAKNNDTAENLAIFYTFTETLMELGVNAQEYFEHVLSLPLDRMKPEELRKELPYFYALRRKEAEAATA